MYGKISFYKSIYTFISKTQRYGNFLMYDLHVHVEITLQDMF
jgi:hypothetical protein